MEWLAGGEGAKVEVGEVIAVLETERSRYDLEASHSGIPHIVTDVSDERICVGGLIAVIAESDEEYDKARSTSGPKMAEEAEAPTAHGSEVDESTHSLTRQITFAWPALSGQNRRNP